MLFFLLPEVFLRNTNTFQRWRTILQKMYLTHIYTLAHNDTFLQQHTQTHKLCLGGCSGNVQIYIIGKCISDLFIKPTALWAKHRRSQAAVGIPRVANQSHLNGANMNWPSRGSFRQQVVHGIARRTLCAFTPSDKHVATVKLRQSSSSLLSFSY